MMAAKGGHIAFIFLGSPLRSTHAVRFALCATAFFTCYFVKLLTRCDGCGCNLQCIYIGITYRNHTEWLWNPFMCDITHITASHTEEIAPCEHNVHTIHFLRRKRKIKKNALCERALTRPLDLLLRMTLCCCFFPQYVASIAGFFFAITRITYALGYYTGGKPAVLPYLMQLETDIQTLRKDNWKGDSEPPKHTHRYRHTRAKHSQKGSNWFGGGSLSHLAYRI